MTSTRRILAIMLIIAFAIPMQVFAQAEGIALDVAVSMNCGEAVFTVDVSEAAGPLQLSWDFGDGQVLQELIETFPYEVTHSYAGEGEYAWMLFAINGDELEGEVHGVVVFEGPQVSLVSDTFPPLVYLEAGAVSIDFFADVSGGESPYEFIWDLNGDMIPDEGVDPLVSSSSYTYTESGKLTASVTVVDSCGLTATASLPVVVIDMDEETECHPMAARIANAVSLLFPDQAETLYTCGDIYDLFSGGEFEPNMGFGRMWHAYHLTETIEEMTWEDILAWQLEGSGWGLLVQLDKFAEIIEDIGVVDLVGMVLSGDTSVNDIRTAYKSVLRYEVDFADALDRIEMGSNPGDLNRLYTLSSELGVEPGSLDLYLESDNALSDIKHAAHLAGQLGMTWEEVLELYNGGVSWGEINQMSRLIADGADPEEISELGVAAYREQQKEADAAARQAEQDQRTAEQFAQKYGLDAGQVMAMLGDTCDWNCVREQLRAQEQTAQQSPGQEVGREDADQRTLEQLVQKYGVTEADVELLYEGICEGDWKCVREVLRDQNKTEHGRPDKPDNPNKPVK